jgi:predicted nucleic acid-binding protein
MLKVFVDSSGWYALVNNQHLNHDLAREYFQKLLTSNAKLYTSIQEVNSAISEIKQNYGLNAALEFSRIIDEANLSSNLHVSWFSRRLRRASLKQFFSIRDQEIDLRHCTIFEDVRKKKINVIFSFDDSLRKFGIPLMPQA